MKNESPKTEKKSAPLLILISAPSGGGKTTLCEQLLKARPDMTRAITCTTREPRPGERDGVDDYVQVAPFACQQVERGVELIIHRHVERHCQLRSQRARERLNPLFHAIVRVRERQFSALPVHSLRDAPGNRAFGGHAYD